MHKDVDLTEKGYFQDYKLPNYNHRPIRKRVPWCRNVDNGAFFARYKNKLNSFLNESYYIYDHDDFDFVNDFDYPETGTFSIEFNNDNITTNTINMVSSWFPDESHTRTRSSTIYSNYGNYILQYTNYSMDQKIKYKNFPLGYRYQIIQSRKKIKLSESSSRKSIKEQLYETCKCCGKPLSYINKFIENTGKTKYTDSFCSEVCKRKYLNNPQNSVKNRWKYDKDAYMERQKKKLGRDEKLYSDLRFIRYFDRQTLQYDRMNRIRKISVPCMSSNINPVYYERRIKNEMSEFYSYYEEQQSVLFAKRSFGNRYDNHVVVKYKGRESTFMRERPWQPKGRVRQDYDQFFDDLKWQDMLKVRIGELESLAPKKKKEAEHRIITEEIQFNDIIDISENINNGFIIQRWIN